MSAITPQNVVIDTDHIPSVTSVGPSASKTRTVIIGSGLVALVVVASVITALAVVLTRNQELSTTTTTTAQLESVNATAAPLQQGSNDTTTTTTQQGSSNITTTAAQQGSSNATATTVQQGLNNTTTTTTQQGSSNITTTAAQQGSNNITTSTAQQGSTTATAAPVQQGLNNTTTTTTQQGSSNITTTAAQQGSNNITTSTAQQGSTTATAAPVQQGLNNTTTTTTQQGSSNITTTAAQQGSNNITTTAAQQGSSNATATTVQQGLNNTTTTTTQQGSSNITTTAAQQGSNNITTSTAQQGSTTATAAPVQQGLNNTTTTTAQQGSSNITTTAAQQGSNNITTSTAQQGSTTATATTVQQGLNNTTTTTAQQGSTNATATTVHLGSNNTTATTTQSGLYVIGKTISSGYQLPLAKQGVDDERFFNSVPNMATVQQSRYNAVLNLVGHKVHKRNVFWHQLETTTLPSNNSNTTCPTGSFKWPSNETQRIQTGCNWFHCMTTATVSLLDTIFRLDTQYGLETAAVIWGTPSTYISPDCIGNTQLGKLPCPPTIEMMPAYYDWIAFIATRWSNIVHYIIGNEVDASTYFDPSPYSNDVNQSIVNTTDGAAWIARYVDLMTTAHRAIAQNRPGIPTMLYVATDRMWTATPWCPGPKWGSRCPLGTGNLLDGIWTSIGTSIDWSVAVHAYGVVNASDWNLRQPYQAYTYQDLPKVIAYQKSKLALDSSISNVNMAPQAFIAATEQAWNSGLPAEVNLTAWYICLAHKVAISNPNLIFATHLDFQEIYTPGANQHGIIPLAAGTYLNGTNANADTALAYGSTNPSVWGVSSQHFCCQNYNLGCSSAG